MWFVIYVGSYDAYLPSLRFKILLIYSFHVFLYVKITFSLSILHSKLGQL